MCPYSLSYRLHLGFLGFSTESCFLFPESIQDSELHSVLRDILISVKS